MHTCKKYEDTITNVFRTPKTHPGWISHWPRRRSLASLHALNGFRPLRRGILQWYSLTSFDWSQRLPCWRNIFCLIEMAIASHEMVLFSFSFVTANHYLCVHQEPFCGFWNFLVTKLPKITVHQVDFHFPAEMFTSWSRSILLASWQTEWCRSRFYGWIENLQKHISRMSSKNTSNIV